MAEPNEENKNNIDLGKILLPKKEVHTPDSAQRTSAGVLLAQEQTAATEGLQPAAAPTPNPDALVGAPTKASGKEESEVKPIQTYQADVESLVEKKNVSVVSIAAAEAQKREKAPIAATPATDEHWIVKRAALVIGGVLLIAVAGGALAYVLTRPTTVPVVPLSTDAPFVVVDDTVQVGIDPTAPAAAIMNSLNVARVQVNLSLGLIERLFVTAGQGSSAQEVPARTLLGALAPQVPQELLRTLSGRYVLAVHSFDENQPFFIFHTDAYETAYAAMLEWEPTMRGDLLPLFTRTPPVHANSNTPPTASSTATSTVATSTTPSDFFTGAAQTLPTPDITQSGIPTTFSDRVVENRDTRVLQTNQGDILLLWTFLDRNTLVITTNEFTLREIITRAARAPTIPLPQ